MGSFDCVRLAPYFAQDDSGFGDLSELAQPATRFSDKRLEI